ncbi:MAG: hypothetical protein AMXMBFR61_27460 [Fimbriimonadales bacterium]
MLCTALTVAVLCLSLQGQPDPSRLVRSFAGVPPPSPAFNPYLAEPKPGDRMVLASTASVIADIASLRALGVDLFLTKMDPLGTPESQEGVWNWSRASAEREAAEQVGAAWGLSVHAAIPNAWQRPSFAGDFLVSAETGRSVPALSPWSPALRAFAEHNWSAVSAQFGSPPVAIVGIHGQFGDAGLLVGMQGLSEELRTQWANSLGSIVETPSFWCADEHAREAFSRAMLTKYGGLEELNEAWGADIETSSPLPLPLGPEFSYVARLDLVRWYLESTTAMSGSLLDVAREACPNSLLLLPIGPPDNSPKIGADITALFKEAAKRKATVLLTVGGYHAFARNHALTLGLARAAARHYGVPIWLQSAAPSDVRGFWQRLAEALCVGASGYLDWHENWSRHGDAAMQLSRYLTVATPKTDVAVLYPSTAQYLRPDQAAPSLYLQGATLLRDYADFDVLDERLILEGALSKYRVAILFEGPVWEAATLSTLAHWLNEGGVLLAYDFGKMATPDGSTEAFTALFPQAATASPAALKDVYEGKTPDVYGVDVTDPKQDWLLEGDWYPPERAGDLPIRYAGANASVRLPLKEGQDYSVTIRCWVPPEAEGYERRVFFEGRLLGKLPRAGEVAYRFVIPAAWVTRPVCRLSIQSDTWRFGEHLAESEDLRDIGLGVRQVVIRRADAAGEPEPLVGRFRPSVEASQVRDLWSAKVGNGLSVFFPATRARMSDYLEVARMLIYRLSEVDPTREDALEIDNRRDGVYTTMLSDKLVFYNSAAAPSTRTVRMPDATEPRTVTVQPGGTAATPLGPNTDEFLLQCEKFLEPGGAETIARPDCSPGTGVTALVVPADSPITTRFEIKAAGSYSLFIRTLRGPDLITPTVLLNDQVVAQPGQGTREGDVIRLGEVQLGEGVHTLTLQDGAAFTADFVIVTSLPKLKGYRFATK